MKRSRPDRIESTGVPAPTVTPSKKAASAPSTEKRLDEELRALRIRKKEREVERLRQEEALEGGGPMSRFTDEERQMIAEHSDRIRFLVKQTCDEKRLKLNEDDLGFVSVPDLVQLAIAVGVPYLDPRDAKRNRSPELIRGDLIDLARSAP